MIFSAKILKKALIFVTFSGIFIYGGTGGMSAQSVWEKKTGYYIVKGMVTDSVTGQPLPHASVTIAGARGGAVADGNGVFEFKVPASARMLQAAMVGYNSKHIPLKQTSHNMYMVALSPSTTTLDEIVVKRGKYSKRNNPAVDFVRRIRAMGSETDPLRNDYYHFNRYERITIALNDFEHSDSDAVIKRFPFLIEHVDTSEVSGKPVLPLSVRETKSHSYYRRDPRSEKTLISGRRNDGIDEFIDPAAMQTFMEDVLREVDLYDTDINLLQNRFVSPLSAIGPDFYRYYLTDTVQLDGERCIVLSFYPRNKAAFGFSGHIYVPEQDSTMFIKQVDMRVPRDINLNFVDNLILSQNYEKAPDGSRLKTGDDLTMELRMVPGTPSIYVRRSTLYDGHSFDAPEDMGVFSTTGPVAEADSATMRSDEWWTRERLKPVDSRGEGRVGLLMKRLRSVPLYYWGEKVVRALSVGYVPVGSPPRFDIGPLNTFMSFNSIEGLRLRFGGITTANLNDRWFFRAMGSYGFKDHRWKYMGEAEYSFVHKRYHSREFPVHSLRFTTSYDINFPGQNYYFTNPDNFFLSLKRKSDYMAVYKRLNELKYTLELRNNFSVTASMSHSRLYATEWMPFVNGHGDILSNFNEAVMQLQLRYAPGEKFYQTTSERIPVNLDAPVLIMRHTLALRGFMGTRYPINKTEISFQKRFWMSAFGYLDTRIGGAHVWSRSPFLYLLIPNANLSYTIQPESYALINPMEFINDSQCNWELTYWANGALLNTLPYIKRLKLREVVSFRGVWGRLSDRNNPLLNPELMVYPPSATTRAMDEGPYMELSAGLDNILRCLRVEYVWRLSYRDVPYAIDRSGLRISFHMTF